MRRLQHASAAASAVLLLVSLSATWWVVVVASGARVEVVGWSASPIASALIVAMAAAYASTLLTRGPLRRAIALVQLGLSAGVLAAWWSALEDPVLQQSAAITRLTGLAGELAREGASASEPSGWVVLGVAGAVLGAVSAVAGVVAPEAAPQRSRFERSPGGNGDDPIDTWDSLSEGTDPTSR